jgi:23S rRNA pseudouridine1911/1915/1917 synthase
MIPSIRILYEDNHLLGVLKPAGVLAQGDKTGDTTALDMARAYIKETYQRPGNVFLGLVHRLDRPVSGVMVIARTSKAASRLSRSFHDRRVEKIYLAVVEGSMTEDAGDLAGFIERTHTRSRLAAKESTTAREASLSFRVLGRGEVASARAGRKAAGVRACTLLEIRPRTGRHHQIRLQLSAAGYPIVGDMKYRASAPLADKAIALHAACLRIPHPVRDEIIEIAAPPPVSAPWTAFTSVLDAYAPPSALPHAPS